MARAACLRQHRGHRRDRGDRCGEAHGHEAVFAQPLRGPSGLAIDAKNRKLFSVCGNRMMAISDPDAGKVVATPAIGAGSDGVRLRSGHGLCVQLERRRHDDDRAADRRQVGGRSRTSRPSAARARSRSTRRRTRCSCRRPTAGQAAGRRPRDVSAGHVQGSDRRQMKTARCCVGQRSCSRGRDRGWRAGRRQQPAPPPLRCQPERAGGPAGASRCRTRSNARRQNDAQFQAASPTRRSRARIACRRKRGAAAGVQLRPRSISATRRHGT